MPRLDQIAVLLYLIVVILGFKRSRLFGIFLAIVLFLPLIGGNALRPASPFMASCVMAGQLACATHFASLALYPKMRPLRFRALVSIPGLCWAAFCLLAWPWMLTSLLGWGVPFVGVPVLLVVFGCYQTLVTKEEELSLDLRSIERLSELQRCPLNTEKRDINDGRCLRLIQITDPHLGPFMSVKRLKQICQRAVEKEPDLILVTGDLMTMESQDVDVVYEALSPLGQASGRVFACHGNHDLEARDVVAKAYQRLGIHLLVDEAASVTTRVGEVEVLGADFKWKQRAQHLETFFDAYPRRESVFRLVLLHDPGAFKHVPDEAADLVLSGHTHGGQLGLLSLGFKATVVSLCTKVPDHGVWALGKNRLYVHRAQGVYGFPLRIGVPAEQSVMSLIF